MTMTPMTPMTPTYFLSSKGRIRFIIIYNIYIIYNNGYVNHPHSEKINYPTVIGVIVIGVIAMCLFL